MATIISKNSALAWLLSREDLASTRLRLAPDAFLYPKSQISNNHQIMIRVIKSSWVSSRDWVVEHCAGVLVTSPFCPFFSPVPWDFFSGGDPP